jgi:hypothetical protein
MIRLPGQQLGDIVLRDDGTLWVAEVGAIAEIDQYRESTADVDPVVRTPHRAVSWVG